MKVKFLQSIAGSGSPDGVQYPQFYFAEGFVGNIPDDTLAQAWIDSGICELAKPEHQCRPPKPEFSVAVTPEVAASRKGPGRPKRVVSEPEPVVEVAEAVSDEATKEG